MKSFHFIIALVLSVASGCLLLSCQKQGEDIVNIPYFKSSFVVSAPFQLYAVSGQISDPSIIARFSGWDTAGLSSLAGNLLIPGNFMDTVVFTTPYSAEIRNGAPGYLHTVSPFQVSSSGGHALLTGLTTLGGSSSYLPYSQSFPYLITAIKTKILSEYLLSSTNGYYQFGYTYLDSHVFQWGLGNHDLVNAPIVLYKYHSSGNFYGDMEYINSPLTPMFFEHIGPGDTVSIQPYILKYVHQ